MERMSSVGSERIGLVWLTRCRLDSSVLELQSLRGVEEGARLVGEFWTTVSDRCECRFEERNSLMRDMSIKMSCL